MAKKGLSIDENFLDLSVNLNFFICQIDIFFGYGHHHISGSINFIKNIFRILFLSGHSHHLVAVFVRIHVDSHERNL